MSDLPHIAKTQIAKFPEVTALVVTDEGGSPLESSGDIDGEACGAVHVVAVQTMDRCGSALGLGRLERVAIASSTRCCVIAPVGQEVLAVYADPNRSIGTLEKKLEVALRR